MQAGLLKLLTYGLFGIFNESKIYIEREVDVFHFLELIFPMTPSSVFTEDRRTVPFGCSKKLMVGKV